MITGDEKAAIDEAHADQVKKIFGVLVESMISDKDATAAVNRAMRGISLSRKARDMLQTAISDEKER